MTKATITLPLRELRDVVDAVLPAVETSGFTPVLHAAEFTLDAGRLTVLATDRYRVHRVRADYKGAKSGTFLVHHDALKWIIKNARFFGKRTMHAIATLEFVTEHGNDLTPTPPGSVTITLRDGEKGGPTPSTASSIAYTLPLVKGTLPPGGRLIDESLAAEPAAGTGRARMDFVAEAHKLARFYGEPGEFRVVKESNPERPGRLLITYERGEVLIQLNLPEGATR